MRQVSRDCLVSYGGSRYSVPHRYAGTQVWVRTSLGVRVEVYDAGGALIATHGLAAKKGLTVLEQEHYAGLRQRTPVTKVVLSAAFLARFPDQQTFLEGLLAHHDPNPSIPLRAVLDLVSIYPDAALRAAFAAAVELHACTPAFVRGLLERGPTRAEAPQRLHVVLAAVPAVQGRDVPHGAPDEREGHVHPDRAPQVEAPGGDEEHARGDEEEGQDEQNRGGRTQRHDRDSCARTSRERDAASRAACGRSERISR